MHHTLLLDFNAADARWLGGLVWKAGFVLWLPQLLMLWYVLSRRGKERNSRGKEVLLLLGPFLVLASSVASAPAIALLLMMYSDVEWGLWLLVLWLPTLFGIGLALATYTTARNQTGAPVLRQSGWTFWLSTVIVVSMLLGALQQWQDQAGSGEPMSTSHEPIRVDQAARAERAREDSIRYHEQWDQKERQPQPW